MPFENKPIKIDETMQMVVDETEANRYRIVQKSANKWVVSLFVNGELLSAQQETLVKRFAASADLLDALYNALPFLEDAQKDPAYKPGAVAKVVKQVRDAITSVEDA